MKIILCKQNNGRWFGCIEDSDDGHGNQIDSYMYTAEQALQSLLEQWEELKNKNLCSPQ